MERTFAYMRRWRGQKPEAQSGEKALKSRPLCIYEEFFEKSVMAQLRVSNEVIPIFPVSDQGQCHVMILDTYLKKLPSDAFEKDIFYLQPLHCIPDDPQKPHMYLLGGTH